MPRQKWEDAILIEDWEKVVNLWAEMIAVGNDIIPNRRSHEKIYDSTTTADAGVGRPCGVQEGRTR